MPSAPPGPVRPSSVYTGSILFDCHRPKGGLKPCPLDLRRGSGLPLEKLPATHHREKRRGAGFPALSMRLGTSHQFCWCSRDSDAPPRSLNQGAPKAIRRLGSSFQLLTSQFVSTPCLLAEDARRPIHQFHRSCARSSTYSSKSHRKLRQRLNRTSRFRLNTTL